MARSTESDVCIRVFSIKSEKRELDQAPQYQNGREAQLANNCVDTANPGNPLAYPAIAHKADERSPFFGTAWIHASFPCAGWSALAQPPLTSCLLNLS